MSLASKSKVPDWHPTASLASLRQRAVLLNKIRDFFAVRNVLEVETPLLAHSTTTDPHIASFETKLAFVGLSQTTPLFLQTSPEYAMKRLLAAGYGSIYQICKAFRNGESGRKHNPEFTLLEWYRVDFTHHCLMDEVSELLSVLLHTLPADRISYASLFQEYFAINPHTCSIESLVNIVAEKKLCISVGEEQLSKDFWLDLLLTHIIEPELGKERPLFIFDYPQTQAALAKIRKVENYFVGERFELYYKGMELANGYHELANSQEQLSRFQQENNIRLEKNLPAIPLDERFINSLSCLPACAGVALGFDRLTALAIHADHLADVLSFPTSLA